MRRRPTGHNSGFLVPSELLAASDKVADYGAETVAFTFFVFTYAQEFPKVQENPIVRAAAVTVQYCQCYTSVGLSTHF